MSQTYHHIWLHYVWTTKNRGKFITPNLKKELIYHIKKYSQQNDIYIDAVNGSSDHIHLLAEMKPNQASAQIANLIEGESANWINQNDFLQVKFAWQNGYGVFSVSASQLKRVRKYILDQEKHHQKMTYQQEVDKFINASEMNIKTSKTMSLILNNCALPAMNGRVMDAKEI